MVLGPTGATFERV